MDMPTVSIFAEGLPSDSSRGPLVSALAASKAPETKTVRQARSLTSEAVAVIRGHLDLQRNREKAAKTMAIVSVVSEAAGFGGHSGRVGMALRMTRNGATAATVMRQGRWSTTRMVARYTRNESTGEALRYL